jgi:hypothetical protein
MGDCIIVDEEIGRLFSQLEGIGRDSVMHWAWTSNHALAICLNMDIGHSHVRIADGSCETAP